MLMAGNSVIPFHFTIFKFQNISFRVFDVTIGEIANFDFGHGTSNFQVRYEPDVKILEVCLIQYFGVSC